MGVLHFDCLTSSEGFDCLARSQGFHCLALLDGCFRALIEDFDCLVLEEQGLLLLDLPQRGGATRLDWHADRRPSGRHRLERPDSGAGAELGVTVERGVRARLTALARWRSRSAIAVVYAQVAGSMLGAVTSMPVENTDHPKTPSTGWLCHL